MLTCTGWGPIRHLASMPVECRSGYRSQRSDNCPLPDSDYRFFTEERALDHFRRIVPLVERGIRPWDDSEVEAAGFEPLALRDW